MSTELDYILSPKCIRDGAKKVFDETVKGSGHFHYHPEKFSPTVDYVMETIRQNYPDLKIPFHSRWGHFRPGGVDRSKWLLNNIQQEDAMERARIMWDLVIPSVLINAGAGKDWKFHETETSKNYDRSEGLGVASYHMFMKGAFASDGKSLRSDSKGLQSVTAAKVAECFQVSATNPLVGVEGRAKLIQNLGKACENKKNVQRWPSGKSHRLPRREIRNNDSC